MIDFLKKGRGAAPMNISEQQVFTALSRLLPEKYTMTSQPEWISFVDPESGESNKYKPDFEIVNERGHRLYVELKSAHAMSLPNMVKLIGIDKALKTENATRLLVIVLGDIGSARFSSRGEFRQLRIRYIERYEDALPAVEDEFMSSFE